MSIQRLGTHAHGPIVALYTLQVIVLQYGTLRSLCYQGVPISAPSRGENFDNTVPNGVTTQQQGWWPWLPITGSQLVHVPLQ